MPKFEITASLTVDDDEIDALACSEVFDRLPGVSGENRIIEGWVFTVVDITVRLIEGS